MYSGSDYVRLYLNNFSEFLINKIRGESESMWSHTLNFKKDERSKSTNIGNPSKSRFFLTLCNIENLHK